MKLNLGCGNDIREGWINLDIAELPGIDVVHDVNNLPLPFEENQFDFILAQDLLEHLEYIPLLKDIHRILKPAGIIEIRVPHYTSRYNFIDPTHKKRFSHKTFEFFVKGSSFNRDYYFDFHFEEVMYTHIHFEKGVLIYNHLLEAFVNLSRKTKTIYEASFLSGIFPAGMMTIRLKK
ncbi:MAG: class I SAM-dependent methyltransferase [Balneola sp.]|nr:MAG: class I SAM-dependent methyltransferase [Balneola sp.]